MTAESARTPKGTSKSTKKKESSIVGAAVFQANSLELQILDLLPKGPVLWSAIYNLWAQAPNRQEKERVKAFYFRRYPNGVLFASNTED